MGAYPLLKLIGEESKGSEEELRVVTMVESDEEVIQYLESLGLNGLVCSLMDLSADLHQLRTRQADTRKANGFGLSKLETDEMNQITRLDWMNEKVDKMRVRYGADAELVVVADSLYWRSEEKERTLRERYEKEQREMVQAAAEGQVINGQSLSNSAHRKRRRILKEQYYGKSSEGVELEFGIAAEEAYDEDENRRGPIKIPLPEDLNHVNPIIRKLVTTLLSKATFVQADREADQAIIAYIRKRGGRSAAYNVTSRPEDHRETSSTTSHRQIPYPLSNPSSSSPNLLSSSSNADPLYPPHPIDTIFVVDGRDGDFVIDFPCDVPNGFFVSDIKRNSERWIRIIDMDALDQAEWFPLKTTEGKSFAQDIVKSDLSAGTRDLGWKILFKNSHLVKLLSEAPSWITLVDVVSNCPRGSKVKITFPDGGIGFVKSIEELDKIFRTKFEECFKTPPTYSWTLSDLARWYHVRHDDQDPTRAISKKEMTISTVTIKLEEGIKRVVNETRNHVSATSPPLFSMPVDHQTTSRFDNAEIRSNPRTLLPLESPFHSFVDAGHRDTLHLSPTSNRQQVGLAGPLGRREAAPSIRSRVSNNGGAINRANALVELTNAAFEMKYGDQADEEAERQNREKMEKSEEFRKNGEKNTIVPSRPKPRKITTSGKESKAGTNSNKGGRGFKINQVFSSRTRSDYLESCVRNLGVTANLLNPIKDGQFRTSVITIFNIFQDFAISQLEQLFTLLRSILLDLSYWHPSTLTDLEFDQRGLVDMAGAIATLSYRIDRANEGEVATSEEINVVVGYYRSYIGKHGSDLLRKALEELGVTKGECGVFEKSKSEWINPISFLHVVREKRRPDHTTFDLNWASFIAHNLSSLHTNFRLASSRRGATIAKDLSEKTVGGLLDLLNREGDFGPNLDRATPLYSSNLKQRANQAGVKETLKLVEGNKAKTGKGLAMVRLGERYINDSRIIINEEEDQREDERLRDGVVGLLSSIRPRILLVIPPPLNDTFDPSTDTGALIDVTSRVLLECFQVLRFVTRKRIEGERKAARRAVEWIRRGLIRRGKPAELLEMLEGFETVGEFFRGGEIDEKWMKGTKTKEGGERGDEESTNSADESEEEGEEGSRRDSEDSDSDEESDGASQRRRHRMELDADDFEAKKGEWAESVRRVGQQFQQILQKPQIARRFHAIAFDLCNLARIVRHPSRIQSQVNLYLPDLVKEQLETIVEEVQSINRSHSDLLRHNSPATESSPPKLSKRIKEIAKRTHEIRTRKSKRKNGSEVPNESWFLDHPFLEIDETVNGPVPVIKINDDKLQELERCCEIVSRVIEGCVIGNEGMTWTDLLAMLEEMGGEITRLIFKMPLGRCLPTGRMLVDGTGLLRLDVVDPLKLVKKGKGSVGGEAILAQLGVSPELGWKAIVPIVLARRQSKLAIAYDYLTFDHVHETVHSSHQPPRNDKLTTYVQEFDSFFDGYQRPLFPLFERKKNGGFVVGEDGTISAAIRLDWTRGSGVVGRQDGAPTTDYGIEYEDLGPIDDNSPEGSKRRRENLDWINDAECQIGMDLGQANLISVTVSRQGETSDVYAIERSGSSKKALRELQHLELADREFGAGRVIGRLFEVDENPVDNLKDFFSNETRAISPSSPINPSVPLRSQSSLPPNLTTRVRLLEGSTRRHRLRRHESRRMRRLERDWARLLVKVTKGAKSIGVAIGDYGRGKNGVIAAGSATESLKAFLNALGSLPIESKVIFVNEAWTSTYCYRCIATLNFPTRQAVNGLQTPILRILECIECRRIDNRDSIGSTNATVVAHSTDLKVPSNILDRTNTELRDRYTRESKREVNRASRIRDEAIRGAQSEVEKIGIMIRERSRREAKPVSREKVKTREKRR